MIKKSEKCGRTNIEWLFFKSFRIEAWISDLLLKGLIIKEGYHSVTDLPCLKWTVDILRKYAYNIP